MIIQRREGLADVGQPGPAGAIAANQVDIVHITHEFATGKDSSMTAIRDIDLTVRGGEFLAVVGPSGCGKSTLLNIISGLLEPTMGHMEVGGIRSSGIRADLGYMPSRDSLLPWRTCQQNVELPLELLSGIGRRERAERARSILASVGLTGFEKHFPAALSHGMRQRVAVARTFATEPAILLMDEPFSALDAQTKITVQDLFLSIWEAQKQTVLFITHDIMEAVALADRVVVLSARPGLVKSIHEIDLPRPRSVKQLLFEEPKFQRYLHDIWEALDV